MTTELTVQEFEPIVKQSGLDKVEQFRTCRYVCRIWNRFNRV